MLVQKKVVPFRNGLFTLAYSDSKEKCEDYAKNNKTYTNNKGKTYKLKVNEIDERSALHCGIKCN